MQHVAAPSPTPPGTLDAPNSPPTAPQASPGASARPVGAPKDLDLGGLERVAKERMGEMAYAYFSGGAEDERLVEANVAAWSAWQLRPRVLVDVSVVDTATTLCGIDLPTPFVVAPTAFHSLAHHQGEVATASGAAEAGAAMVLSSVSTCALEEVAAEVPGAPRLMQVYVLKDRARTEEMVVRAAAAGYRALVLTVDAPVCGLRRRELRGEVRLPADLALPNLTGSSSAAAHQGGFMALVTEEIDPGVTFDDITWLAEVSGLPVLAKGVLRGDDAARCAEAGAAGIVVSNHGARQLDDAPPTAEVLSEVVEAVDGRTEVAVDGGIRRAADAAKALALGARAVWVGRPVLWALGAGGPAGVTELLQWLTEELRRTMALCGACDLAALDASAVRPAGLGGRT